MNKEIIKKTLMVVCIVMLVLMIRPLESTAAEETDELLEEDIESPYEYVVYASCYLTISNGNATVSSYVDGKNGTTSTSVTVYLEKLVNGSWQPYTSWTHNGGRNQDNSDSTPVQHGAYRARMSVTATGSGGSESFNVDGNVAGY